MDNGHRQGELLPVSRILGQPNKKPASFKLASSVVPGQIFWQLVQEPRVAAAKTEDSGQPLRAALPGAKGPWYVFFFTVTPTGALLLKAVLVIKCTPSSAIALINIQY